MSWDDPLGDLRRLLADTEDDNLVKNKAVFGQINGTNRQFFTFDDRLLASGVQSVCDRPLRLWYDTTEVAASGIRITNQLRGDFEVMSPPSAGTRVTASYYYQNSLDSELNFFLEQASLQVNTAQVSQVDPALRLAVLSLAAGMANERLASRWQQRKSAQFQLLDEPVRNEMDARIKYHQDEAARLNAKGLELRRSFYDLRQDRGRSPAYGLLKRTPSPWYPKR